MAGHSKWANIKHRKGAQDKAKAKAFTKASKAIMTAVKSGGPDPEGNLTLKYAMEQARSVNMPKDTIERAIKSAMGSQDANSFEELVYEGYGAGGVAVMVDALTDNRNRTAPEVRKLFEKFGGKLGATGCVAHMFARRTLVTVPRAAITEEALMDLALGAGAEEIQEADGLWEIQGAKDAFATLKAAFDGAKIPTESVKIGCVPAMSVAVQDDDTAKQILKLMEALDDLDDVQEVHANFDISDEIMERLTA